MTVMRLVGSVGKTGTIKRGLIFNLSFTSRLVWVTFHDVGVIGCVKDTSDA